MIRIFFLVLLMILTWEVQAQVSYSQFQDVVKVFHQVFDQELRKKNEVLVVNNSAASESQDIWWNFSDRHASYSSYRGSDGVRIHFLFMFGGFARISGMTQDGLAMTLCHELGHGVGGAPYKDSGDNYLVTVEGQADYFAARNCIKKIYAVLPAREPSATSNPWAQNQCRSHFSELSDYKMCLRAFQSLEVEREFFRTQPGIEAETHFETPDLSVSDRVNLHAYFYPSAQCRLDTMMAGILEKSQPCCWWAP